MAIKQPQSSVKASIRETLKRDLYKDATDFHKSVDSIVELALNQLFAMKLVERKLLYRSLPRKRAGRPPKFA